MNTDLLDAPSKLPTVYVNASGFFPDHLSLSEPKNSRTITNSGDLSTDLLTEHASVP